MTTTKTDRKLDRLSIDIDPTEHIKIKMFAAVSGKTIKQFVLESVREHVRQEIETRDLRSMTAEPTGALLALWSNQRDATYDDV